MNRPSPALVSQAAVLRLPRWALLLLCLAYTVPGFIGRETWRAADLTEFAYMAELARGGVDWLAPTLMGLAPEVDALLPYWLGAWAITLAPSGLSPELASRVPFALLLGLTLWAAWWGTYYLALSPKAQPVAFAFGGEAPPTDYARAIADGGLLAFMACLGLAQLAHETTPALAQLSCTALIFYAFAALPFRTLVPLLCGALGLTGLALSGAPSLALLFGATGTLLGLLDRSPDLNLHSRNTVLTSHRAKLWLLLGLTVLLAVLASAMNLWQWRIALPPAQWLVWRNLGRLLLWFTWPAWPLALWTLWRWRHQIGSGELHRYLTLPLGLLAIALASTLLTSASHRSLLLALPALAALAAFALPTLQRSVAALIDWFTLLFFSGCALVIWVVWLAMQTGVPVQPAANVARLAPGFVASFSWWQFLPALVATLVWIALVRWRVGRHRSAIWKSLVLPAGGTTLCWLLLMTLWLPLLDFSRSYSTLIKQIKNTVQDPACVEVRNLSRAQIAALRTQTGYSLQPAQTQPSCPWLMVGNTQALDQAAIDPQQWHSHSRVYRQADKGDPIHLYQRRVGN